MEPKNTGDISLNHLLMVSSWCTVHSKSPRLNVGSTVITQHSTPVDGAQNLTRSSSWVSDTTSIAGTGKVLILWDV